MKIPWDAPNLRSIEVGQFYIFKESVPIEGSEPDYALPYIIKGERVGYLVYDKDKPQLPSVGQSEEVNTGGWWPDYEDVDALKEQWVKWNKNIPNKRALISAIFYTRNKKI